MKRFDCIGGTSAGAPPATPWAAVQQQYSAGQDEGGASSAARRRASSTVSVMSSPSAWDENGGSRSPWICGGSRRRRAGDSIARGSTRGRSVGHSFPSRISPERLALAATMA